MIAKILMLVFLTVISIDCIAQTDSTTTTSTIENVDLAANLPWYGFGEDAAGDKVLFVDSRGVKTFGQYARYKGVNNDWIIYPRGIEVPSYSYGSRSFYFCKPLNQRANIIEFCIIVDTVSWEGVVYDKYLTHEAVNSAPGNPFHLSPDSPGVVPTKDGSWNFKLEFNPTYKFEERVPDN
ncbi:MAG TPA: hypothetical protein PK720_02475 [bacterium]|nr:hypothetical protein [bacterium]